MFHDKGSAVVHSERLLGHSRRKKVFRTGGTLELQLWIWQNACVFLPFLLKVPDKSKEEP